MDQESTVTLVAPVSVSGPDPLPVSVITPNPFPVLLSWDAPTSPKVDAFGRFRVSFPETLLASKQIFDPGTNTATTADTWTIGTLSGGGTSSAYVAGQAATTLSVSANTAGRIVRQTTRWLNYQAAKSQQVFLSFVFGAATANVAKRAGYFNDSDGVFLQQLGTAYSMNLRTSTSGSPVTASIPQASWNIDRLDGAGPSGIVLDGTKDHIFTADLEWLGVGTVAVGLVINRQIYYVHAFNHANSLDKVYMANPNLPLRYEIENLGTGGAASMTTICGAVSSEGGAMNVGSARVAHRGTAPFSGTGSGTIRPLLAIRLKSGCAAATVIPQMVSVVTANSSVMRWSLLLNPTVAGTALNFSTAIANSAVEADVATTNATSVSGGTELASGYAKSETGPLTPLGVDVALGTTAAGVSDILVLAGQFTANESAYPAINWLEQQ